MDKYIRSLKPRDFLLDSTYLIVLDCTPIGSDNFRIELIFKQKIIITITLAVDLTVVRTRSSILERSNPSVALCNSGVRQSKQDHFIRK
ncbi:MAG: hypothetical protein WBZ36_17820, partial [Candidatus Nitrosopolaris sp.]